MKRTLCMVYKFILIFFFLQCQTQMFHFQKKNRERIHLKWRLAVTGGGGGGGLRQEMKCRALFGSVSFYMTLLFSG